MNWFGWLYTILSAFTAVVYITRVGKPREPVTALEAAFTVLFTGLFIWGFATIGTLA